MSDQDTLLKAVRERQAGGRGFTVATLNLDHVAKIAVLPDFAQAYMRHDYVVADGRPVVWLSWIAGHPVKLTPGSELILPLCRVALDLGARVALIGSTDSVLQTAAGALQAQFPGLHICAKISPSQSFDPYGEEANHIIAELRRTRAQLCFVALGAPKQECFAARAHVLVPQAGFVSIGAGLDFISGHQRRAPRIFRRLALEWFWRMLENPRRMIPRYARCFLILPRLGVVAFKTRLAGISAD